VFERRKSETCWKLTALKAVGLDLAETKDIGRRDSNPRRPHSWSEYGADGNKGWKIVEISMPVGPETGPLRALPGGLLNNIKTLEDHGIRLMATQGLGHDIQNAASRLLLHVLGAAAEFERSLIRKRIQAGKNKPIGRLGKLDRSRIATCSAPLRRATKRGAVVAGAVLICASVPSN
jgi:hypothetical protein